MMSRYPWEEGDIATSKKESISSEEPKVSNQDFIDAVFRHLPDASRVVVTGFEADPNSNAPGIWSSKAVFKQLPESIVPHHNNYFSVSSIKPGDDGLHKRIKANFSACHVIVLDDIGYNGKVSSDDILLPPSYEIETSPDNSQLGYILTEPVFDVKLIERVFNQLKKKGLTDKNGVNPVRWVRLPVAVNTKAAVVEMEGRPFESVLHKFDPNVTYTLDEIIEGLGLDIESEQNSGNLSFEAIPILDIERASEEIKTGESLHDNLRDKAAHFIAKGLDPDEVVRILQNEMNASAAPRDGRFQSRYNDIPRAVKTALDKGYAPSLIPVEDLTEDEIKEIAWTQESEDINPTPDFIVNHPFQKIREASEYIAKCGTSSVDILNLVGALVLAQAVTGRKYYSAQYENSTNIYMVVQADTAGGKDAVKKGVQRILMESDLLRRLGKGRFASGAGIETELKHKPCQVCILDEFGDQLNHGLNDNGGHAVTQLRMLKAVFSDSTGVMEQTGVSTRGLNRQQKDDIEKPVFFPTLSIVGLTTSEQFYGSLRSEMVHDGFLNRILTIDVNRQKKTKNDRTNHPVPQSIIDHIKIISEKRSLLSDAPEIENSISDISDLKPSQYLIPFTDDAVEFINQIGEADPDPGTFLYKYQNSSKNMRRIRIPLSGRWREIAMRLATCISAYEGHDQITRRTLEWCWNFVFYYGDQFITNFDQKACVTEYQQIKNACLEKIREYPEGISKRDIGRTNPFRGMKTRERNEILQDLVECELVKLVPKPTSICAKNPVSVYIPVKTND